MCENPGSKANLAERVGPADAWVKASAWTAKRFRCDYREGCQAPVGFVYVLEGWPQLGSCERHYVEACAAQAAELAAAAAELQAGEHIEMTYEEHVQWMATPPRDE